MLNWLVKKVTYFRCCFLCTELLTHSFPLSNKPPLFIKKQILCGFTLYFCHPVASRLHLSFSSFTFCMLNYIQVWFFPITVFCKNLSNVIAYFSFECNVVFSLKKKSRNKLVLTFPFKCNYVIHIKSYQEILLSYIPES